MTRSGRYVVLVCLSLAADTAKAQWVRGTVVDTSGSGLPGVTVFLLNSAGLAVRRARTGNAGDFAVDVAETGSHVIRAQRIGFEPAEVSVILKRDDTIRVRIRLQAASSCARYCSREGQA
jgi:hypothetical protein